MASSSWRTRPPGTRYLNGSDTSRCRSLNSTPASIRAAILFRMKLMASIRSPSRLDCNSLDHVAPRSHRSQRHRVRRRTGLRVLQVTDLYRCSPGCDKLVSVCSNDRLPVDHACIDIVIQTGDLIRDGHAAGVEWAKVIHIDGMFAQIGRAHV